MTDSFKLLMIGAMYENGGNTSHRFLDGHPQLFVYPFESQVGSKLVNDHMSSLFPLKYRWPTFALDATPEQDYRAIIDEEGKVRSRTPHVSKFRHMPFDMNDDERMSLYVQHIMKTGRSRAKNMAAFFQATFEAWKDYKRSGKEEFYVGYSPIITVDADKILDEMPDAHFLHVVRNPWSAYADTKKRPVPMKLADYILAWNLNQYFALLFKEKYPDRMHIVRTEDVMENPEKALGGILKEMGLQSADTLRTPSWNGEPLQEVYPWGTIRTATPEANLATANELTAEEKQEIRERAWQYLEVFNYSNFLTGKVLSRT
jgi:hypothetical protein